MNKLFGILEDDFDAKVLPPNPPSFLLVRVVQLITLHQLTVVPGAICQKSLLLKSILDEECVEPEEEGAVVIANRDAFGRASEHELDILVHEGRLDQGHLKSVSLKLVELNRDSESQKLGLPSSHN